MKSLLKDLTALALVQDLTVSQLNNVRNLIKADLITLRNGVASLGTLMSVASAGNKAVGQENLGNIGELLTLMANQISALHLLDGLAEYTLTQGGEVGSIPAMMDAKMAVCNAFDMEANTNPCPEQSTARGFYEAGYATLTNDDLVEIVQ